MFLEFVLILAAAHRLDASVLVTLSIYPKNIKYFLSPEIILRLMSFDLKLLRRSPGGRLPFEFTCTLLIPEALQRVTVSFRLTIL